MCGLYNDRPNSFFMFHIYRTKTPEVDNLIWWQISLCWAYAENVAQDASISGMKIH